MNEVTARFGLDTLYERLGNFIRRDRVNPSYYQLVISNVKLLQTIENIKCLGLPQHELSFSGEDMSNSVCRNLQLYLQEAPFNPALPTLASVLPSYVFRAPNDDRPVRLQCLGHFPIRETPEFRFNDTTINCEPLWTEDKLEFLIPAVHFQNSGTSIAFIEGTLNLSLQGEEAPVLFSICVASLPHTIAKVRAVYNSFFYGTETVYHDPFPGITTCVIRRLRNSTTVQTRRSEIVRTPYQNLNLNSSLTFFIPENLDPQHPYQLQVDLFDGSTLLCDRSSPRNSYFEIEDRGICLVIKPFDIRELEEI